MIIAPAPMQKESIDQTELRKALSDLTQSTNNELTVLTKAVAAIPAPVTFVLPGWQPYPAGAYTFPSGAQTVAAGFMPIGATGSPAPTFGSDAIHIGEYMDNGNKTINIRGEVRRVSGSACVDGSGWYVCAPPLGYEIDVSKMQLCSDIFKGSNLGFFNATGNASGSYILNGKCSPYSSKLIVFSGLYSAAAIGFWSSSYFRPTPFSELIASFEMFNIPIL